MFRFCLHACLLWWMWDFCFPHRVLWSLWELLLRMILDSVAENRGVQVEFYTRFQYTIEVSDLLNLSLHKDYLVLHGAQMLRRCWVPVCKTCSICTGLLCTGLALFREKSIFSVDLKGRANWYIAMAGVGVFLFHPWICSCACVHHAENFWKQYWQWHSICYKYLIACHFYFFSLLNKDHCWTTCRV